MAAIADDLRLSCRRLARTPGFFAVALLSLALGIGANTTIFSLIDSVLLRPLPVHEPERLVAVYSSREGKPFRDSTYADYVDYADGRVFSGLAASRAWQFSLAAESSQLLTGELVSANYFAVLGVQPVLGQGLEGSSPEAPRAGVVVSHSLWQRAFGGHPSAVGKSIELNGHGYTIFGVAPRGFRGPSLDSRSQIWMPLGNYDRVATGFWSHFDAVSYDVQRTRGRGIAMWSLIGRLRPDVSLAQARSTMAAIDQALDERHPASRKSQFATLVPAIEAATPPESRPQATRLVLLLLAAVGSALLIACTNVASLLLARADERRQEIGIRLAVGASRRRLVRQLLTESVVLAILGGGAGLLVATWGFDLLTPFHLPGGIAIGDLDLSLDTRVLAFTFAAAVASGLLFGLVPALQASRHDLVGAVAARAATAGPGSSRFRFAMIAIQVGLAVVLLVGAGLFARSLQQGLTANLGFDARGVLTMTFDLGLERYDEAGAQAWYSDLLHRLRATSGIRNASVTSSPFGEAGVGVTGIHIEGRGRVDSDRITLSRIDNDYFRTLAIPLLAGRGFDRRDSAGGNKVLIINQTMAQTFWPGDNAVGQRLNFAGADAPYFEVVGVVADCRYLNLREAPQRYVYMPLSQHWSHASGNEMTLVVRSAGEPLAPASSISRILADLDRHVPAVRVATLDDRVAETLMPQRMGTVFLGLFSLMALILAAAGIFAVVAYAVVRRTREIGLRIALGAEPRAVSRLFLRRGLAPVTLGLALGFAAAAAATRWIESLLYEVRPFDPVSFIAAAVMLLLVGCIACWLPARTASRLDPTIALRHE